MSTDPKRNDEIKDEELEDVSGGAIKRTDESESSGDPATSDSPKRRTERQ